MIWIGLVAVVFLGISVVVGVVALAVLTADGKVEFALRGSPRYRVMQKRADVAIQQLEEQRVLSQMRVEAMHEQRFQKALGGGDGNQHED